jgi:hypothetical protein
MAKRKCTLFKICVAVIGAINSYSPSLAFQLSNRCSDRKNIRPLTVDASYCNTANNHCMGPNVIFLTDCHRYSSRFLILKNSNTLDHSEESPIASFQKSRQILISTSRQLIHSCVTRTMKFYQTFNRKIRKYVVAFIFMMTMIANTAAFAAATSGGRVGGGSFKTRSSSSSISRPSRLSTPSSSTRQYYNSYNRPRTIPIPRISSYYHQSSSPIVVHHFSGAPIMSPYTVSAIKDIFLVTGTGALIAYAISKNAYRSREPDDTYGTVAGGMT